MSDSLPEIKKLESSKVPQADSPDTLIHVLSSIAAGSPLDLDTRQVQYYCSAARLLGLLSNDRRLLAPGRVLLTLAKDVQYARLAIAFERSECARAWASWQRVRSVLEVQAETAEQFVNEMTLGLRGKTPGRRVTTLRSWHKKLLPFHPARCTEPKSVERRGSQYALGHTTIFERGASAKALQLLAKDTQVLRVATAYLSVNGYEILTAPLHEARLRLLVGSEETFLSVAQILARFRQSVESGPPSGSKLLAIKHLHLGAVTGSVRVRYFDPRFKPRLHAKVYIFDHEVAHITSANLSRAGFRSNIEAGYTVRDAEAVRYYLNHFDGYFESAEDLVPILLPILEESWAYQPPTSPYLLYLRVLLELFPIPPDLSRETDYRLSPYQSMIVSAVLRTLRERRRALLVAPTGTGKTVMGSYIAAALLKSEVHRVFILCPNDRIKADWLAKLDGFGRTAEVITHGVMQRKGRQTENAKQRLEQRLAAIRPTDLVIVDECHAFRNQDTNGYDSVSRLIEGSGEQSAPWLLLLTATPMSKGIEDLNTLLGLLLDGPLETIDAISRTRSVVNVTLPFIVEHFGTDEKGGRGQGIEFGSDLRYFAAIRVRSQRYRSTMEPAFRYIEDMPLEFRRLRQRPRRRLSGLRGKDLSERRYSSGFLRLTLMRRAESSPEAMRKTIGRIRCAVDERRLVPVDPPAFIKSLLQLEELIPSPSQDLKLLELFALLRAYPPRRKVLIFSLWTATVQYLAKEIASEFVDRRVATITGDLSNDDRTALINRFAPTAQGLPARHRRDSIDILVATDAIAEGENLQDADVLINYDLPWTPLYLIQRVGRVDRPTKQRREVDVRNFYPESDLFERMLRLWERLTRRADLYAVMSRTQVLEEHDRDLEQLGERDLNLVRSFYENGDFDQLAKNYLPTSAWLVDLAKATEKEKERARALPTGTLSVKPGGRPGKFVLVRSEDGLRCIFAPGDGGALEVSPDGVPHEQILQSIRADRREEATAISPNLVTGIGSVVKQWSEATGNDENNITVICAEDVRGSGAT